MMVVRSPGSEVRSSRFGVRSSESEVRSPSAVRTPARGLRTWDLGPRTPDFRGLRTSDLGLRTNQPPSNKHHRLMRRDFEAAAAARAVDEVIQPEQVVAQL